MNKFALTLLAAFALPLLAAEAKTATQKKHENKAAVAKANSKAKSDARKAKSKH